MMLPPKAVHIAAQCKEAAYDTTMLDSRCLIASSHLNNTKIMGVTSWTICLFLKLFFWRYEELDANKGLLSNLKGKVVIEYPTLHVVLKKFKKDLAMLDPGKRNLSPSPPSNLPSFVPYPLFLLDKLAIPFSCLPGSPTVIPSRIPLAVPSQKSLCNNPSDFS